MEPMKPMYKHEQLETKNFVANEILSKQLVEFKNTKSGMSRQFSCF